MLVVAIFRPAVLFWIWSSAILGVRARDVWKSSPSWCTFSYLISFFVWKTKKKERNQTKQNKNQRWERGLFASCSACFSHVRKTNKDWLIDVRRKKHTLSESRTLSWELILIHLLLQWNNSQILLMTPSLLLRKGMFPPGSSVSGTPFLLKPWKRDQSGDRTTESI